jgi:hypothetical protein
VKKFSWWSVVGLAAATVALSSCGSSGNSSSNANVRVANATLSHASIDLLVNAAVAAPAVATDTVSAYVAPASGSVTLQVNDAGGATALVTAVPTLTGGHHYTLLAYESGGAVKTAVISEDVALPAAGVTTLRIYDAAIEAGPLDVYITTATDCKPASLPASPTTSFGSLTAVAAVSLTQGAGTYTVCATAAGKNDDLRMTLPITIAGQTVASVLMTPASGGALIDGSLLIQQGAYAPVRNTNARVRVAAAVSGGATVTVTSSDGTQIFSGVSPGYGFYTLVPASSTLNVTDDKVGSVQVSSGALVKGGDATLLVYEDAGVAKARLIADDNRPPTSATATKLRLVNGVTGSAGTLTLTANSSPVGVNIAPGVASNYQSLIGTTNTAGSANTFSFGLSSSTAGVLTSKLGTSASATVNSNATYSILAVGDISAPQLLVLP